MSHTWRGTPPLPATFIPHEQGAEDGRRSVWPLLITIAVAVFGVCSMLIVDHGLWNKRPVPNPKMAHYSSTEDAAKAVGATASGQPVFYLSTINTSYCGLSLATILGDRSIWDLFLSIIHNPVFHKIQM
jgi:hypothetical protein